MGALDILQSAKATVTNDLGKLQSLKHVGRKLKEYEGLVSDLLTNRFVTLAVTIPVDTGGAGSSGGGAGADNAHGFDQSWGTPESLGGDGSGGSGGGRVPVAAAESNGGGGDELRRDLELIVQGLLRLGEVEKVVGVVQERVSEDLKLIIR